MPQPKKGPRLGSNPKHQRLMLSNLALSLFEHERVKTTEAKAKALRPFAERLITKAKSDDLHRRRQVLSVIEDREIVHKLFADIGPRFAERPGGYTRILKLGPRPGDGAPMALVELVEGAGPAAAEAADDETGRRRLRRPARSRKAAGAEAEADEGAVAEQEVATTAEEDSPAAAEAPEEGAEETPEEAGGDASADTPGDAEAETSQDEPTGAPDEDEKSS